MKRTLAIVLAVTIQPLAACAVHAGAPAATPIAAPAAAPVVAPAPAPKHPSFAGVWQLAASERVYLPETNGTLTPEAKASIEHFKKFYKGDDADPAVKVCLNKGMPWTALSRARDYPTEIIQYDDNIFIKHELYDQYRHIRMNGPAKPDNYPESPNGWSVAHWEGDTLVIETTGLPALNLIGPNLRGNNAKVVERWTLKQDPELGELWVVDLDQIDPEIYTGPAHGHVEMRRAAPGTVVGGYNCSAALWDEHVSRMEERIAKHGGK